MPMAPAERRSTLEPSLKITASSAAVATHQYRTG
jgi:hypothetical protein